MTDNEKLLLKHMQLVISASLLFIVLHFPTVKKKNNLKLIYIAELVKNSGVLSIKFFFSTFFIFPFACRYMNTKLNRIKMEFSLRIYLLYLKGR